MTNYGTQCIANILRRGRAMGLGLVLTVGLAACGGDDASDASTSTETVSLTSTESGSADGSPLAAILGFGEDDLSTFFTDSQSLVQDKIASCMRLEGFEYTPVTVSAEQLEAFASPETRDEVADIGFGMSRNVNLVADLAASTPADPNVTYTSSLSPAELDAYQETLYGMALSDLAAPGESSEDEQDEPQGCFGEANADVFAKFAVLEEIDDELTAMEEATDADPRMVELDKAWATCIAEKGYDFATPDDARQSVSDRIQVLREAGSDESIEDLSADEISALTPEEIRDRFMPQIDENALAQVESYEIEIALAVFDCSEPQEQERDDITFEYEQRVIDENQDVFDRLDG